MLWMLGYEIGSMRRAVMSARPCRGCWDMKYGPWEELSCRPGHAIWFKCCVSGDFSFMNTELWVVVRAV